MSLTIQSGGSITLQGGAGGGGAISAVYYAQDMGVWQTSSSTYTAAGRSIQITATTGTKVLVTISAFITGHNSTGTGHASVAVSGATTRAASDNWSAANSNIRSYSGAGASATFVMSDLTPGSNTFTVQFRSDTMTQEFSRLHFVVQTLT